MHEEANLFRKSSRYDQGTFIRASCTAGSLTSSSIVISYQTSQNCTCIQRHETIANIIDKRKKTVYHQPGSIFCCCCCCCCGAGGFVLWTVCTSSGATETLVIHKIVLKENPPKMHLKICRIVFR